MFDPVMIDLEREQTKIDKSFADQVAIDELAQEIFQDMKPNADDVDEVMNGDDLDYSMIARMWANHDNSGIGKHISAAITMRMMNLAQTQAESEFDLNPGHDPDHDMEM